MKKGQEVTTQEGRIQRELFSQTMEKKKLNQEDKMRLDLAEDTIKMRIALLEGNLTKEIEEKQEKSFDIYRKTFKGKEEAARSLAKAVIMLSEEEKIESGREARNLEELKELLGEVKKKKSFYSSSKN